MKQSLRVLAVLFPLAVLLSSCGGSGGSGDSSNSSTAGSSSDNFSAGGANVVAVSVNPGPASADSQTFNIPLVSVTVCEPGTTTCATIPNVLVDTGSSGLRLMASVVASSGISLPAMEDSSKTANTIAECLPFADGYTWGSVANATVKVGGETTTGAIPVQVIDDNGSAPAVAPDCASSNDDTGLDSIDDFDANGVIGIGLLVQDCGSACVGANNEADGVYWSCPPAGGSNCQLASAMTLAEQVANPVASFPTDNNGVILQLASIPAAGATTDSGYLVFGIGTESNNALGTATVLTADDEGNFSTTFDGNSPSSLPSSFIDSGSNALYFNDSSLALCGNSEPANEFFCPASTVSLSATNQGANGTSSVVSFQIANLTDIADNYFAIDDVGGPATPIAGFGAYFDWGLPFFYGRTVFIAIAGGSYPNGYYAY